MRPFPFLFPASLNPLCVPRDWNTESQAILAPAAMTRWRRDQVPSEVWKSCNDPSWGKNFPDRMKVPGRDERAKEKSNEVTPRDLARAAQVSLLLLVGQDGADELLREPSNDSDASCESGA